MDALECFIFVFCSVCLFLTGGCNFGKARPSFLLSALKTTNSGTESWNFRLEREYFEAHLFWLSEISLSLLFKMYVCHICAYPKVHVLKTSRKVYGFTRSHCN